MKKLPAYMGYLDGVAGGAVFGWVCKTADFSDAIEVDIFVDDVFVGSTLANKHRQDLEDAGLGGGMHQFNLQLPGKCCDGKQHEVSVKLRAFNEALPNCPVVFTWSPGVNKHKNSTGREVFLNRLSALDHHVDRTICTHDIMHFGNDEAYFSIGRSIVEQVASCLITEKHYNPSRIFDFGCGYGRATRFLKALFPDAAFTVADPLALAVEFCADQFGAKGYHCSPDNPVTDAAGPFDIILLYSVINHLDETLSEAILDGLSRKLGEDGLLIFTVGNPGFSHSRYRQNEGQNIHRKDWRTWRLMH